MTVTRIGIIGGGVVGNALARCFIEHVEVRVHDTVPERRTHSLRETLFSDLVFVCLPSPQKKDSLECDTSIIEGFFREATEIDGRPGQRGFYVLRSTVPVGFTRRMSEEHGIPELVHSPEFLTARCAVTDAQIPARNIIGSPQVVFDRATKGRTDKILLGQGSQCLSVLRDLYLKRFPGVPVLLMSSDESEAVKLFQNSLFATKIALLNEFHAFATAKKLDWERIIAAILTDGRIAHSHTKVPGPDGKYGFGGECLVKDLASLVSQMVETFEAFSYDYPLVTRAAYRRNMSDRQRKE